LFRAVDLKKITLGSLPVSPELFLRHVPMLSMKILPHFFRYKIVETFIFLRNTNEICWIYDEFRFLIGLTDS
jgi:hypothetical protein